MRNFIITTLFILGCFNASFGQENIKVLRGKVESLQNDVSNILIVNINSKKSTITDSLGLFSIEVKLRDSLSITALQYLPKSISITPKMFKDNKVIISLSENIITLNEVTITPYNLTGKLRSDLNRLNVKKEINARTLELPNANLIKMTQSERLLIEADRGKYYNFYVVALTINTHKIMNRLSGRTKSFEEMIEREEKMNLEEKIIAKFSKESMCDNFKISKSNIDGFLTYCLSQEDFLSLAEAGNSIEVWDYLKAKSVTFKKNDSVVEY